MASLEFINTSVQIPEVLPKKKQRFFCASTEKQEEAQYIYLLNRYLFIKVFIQTSFNVLLILIEFIQMIFLLHKNKLENPGPIWCLCTQETQNTDMLLKSEGSHH